MLAAVLVGIVVGIAIAVAAVVLAVMLKFKMKGGYDVSGGGREGKEGIGTGEKY